MKPQWSLAALPFFLAAIFSLQPADAAVFNVSDSAELEAALQESGSNGEADIINLAAGTYQAAAPFSYTAGADENFNLTLQGAGPGLTVLDGQGDKRAFMIDLLSASQSEDIHISLHGLTFTHGQTPVVERGGGVHALLQAASIQVTDAEFIENHAQYIAGGLLIRTDGDVTVDRCRFEGNTAAIQAGGLGIENSNTLLVRNSIFTNNAALNNSGGGMVVGSFEENEPKSVFLTNNTFYANTASSQGGGAVLVYTSMGGSGEIHNNIFFANTSGAGSDDLLISFFGGFIEEPVTVNYFHNIIFSAAHNCNDCGDFSFLSGDNLAADPRFVDAAAHDFALAADSPAIHTGNSGAPGLSSLDFLGNPRVIGAAVDRGAIEAQIPVIAADPAELNLGSVPVGENATAELTIRNEGGSDLQVVGISLSDPTHFSLDVHGGSAPCGGESFFLAVGESCTVLVTFMPLVEGVFTAHVTLKSNDPLQPELPISLKGHTPKADIGDPDLSPQLPVSPGFGGRLAGGGCALGAASSSLPSPIPWGFALLVLAASGYGLRRVGKSSL